MRKIILLHCIIFQVFAQNPAKVDSLQNLLKISQADSAKFKIYHKLANQYLHNNKDSARKYIDLELQYAQKSKKFLNLGLAHNINGVFLNNHNQYDLGIKEILKGIDYFEKANDIIWVGIAHSTIGYAYKRMADAQNINSFTLKGEEWVKKGIEILTKVKEYKELPGPYINLGIIQRDLKNYEGARKSFLKGIEYAKQFSGKELDLAILYADLGQNFIDFGKDYDQAIYYLKKSIPLYEQQTYTKGIEHAHRNLADAYRLKKDYTKAIQHANTAVAIAKNLHENHRLFNAYNSLYMAKEAAGDFKGALENLKLAKAFEDSTLRNEKLKTIAEVETKYQTVKKEAEINVLGEKNRLQSRQMWYLIGGLALSMVFLGLIYFQNQKIKESRKQISKQADQLKLMMKELHHRVKNNLAIVSGLLRIQSSKLEDESAIQAVRQGQQRVDAMSLIHQRLYQTDKISTINIKEYITDLAESLMSAYGYEPHRFELNISVEKEELDIDLAIPLGLIINELLTNAFKYAYQNIQKPALNIILKGDKNLHLEISDNGIGIDLNRWKTAKDSFGKKMITGLVNQIGGKFTIENDGGTVFRMVIAA